jgi:abortive infection bacteriophage resistance protein
MTKKTATRDGSLDSLEPKQSIKDEEHQRFSKAINHEQDNTMLVLRTHLYTESLLERIILLKLPRGDKIIESASLSYSQKLVLVDALGGLSDPIVSSLRNINKLRNLCAHELSKLITEADAVKIGSPLGKFFTEARTKANNEPTKTLQLVFSYVCGYMAGACHEFERQQIDNPSKPTQA